MTPFALGEEFNSDQQVSFPLVKINVSSTLQSTKSCNSGPNTFVKKRPHSFSVSMTGRRWRRLEVLLPGSMPAITRDPPGCRLSVPSSSDAVAGSIRMPGRLVVIGSSQCKRKPPNELCATIPAPVSGKRLGTSAWTKPPRPLDVPCGNVQYKQGRASASPVPALHLQELTGVRSALPHCAAGLAADWTEGVFSRAMERTASGEPVLTANLSSPPGT